MYGSLPSTYYFLCIVVWVGGGDSNGTLSLEYTSSPSIDIAFGYTAKILTITTH